MRGVAMPRVGEEPELPSRIGADRKAANHLGIGQQDDIGRDGNFEAAEIWPQYYCDRQSFSEPAMPRMSWK